MKKFKNNTEKAMIIKMQSFLALNHECNEVLFTVFNSSCSFKKMTK